MAFFNNQFTDHSIFSAWRKQQTDLRTQRLQPYNDILYEAVKKDILDRREEIHAALMMVAATSLTPQGLSVPLWTYHTARYKTTDPALVEKTEQLLRRKGYKWYVGLVYHEFNSDALQYNTEDDWDSIWRWRVPRSVDEVVRHTDFLNRINLLFGEDEYRISFQPVAQKVLKEPLDVTVERIEVRLHYHPKGVYSWVRNSLQKTKDKYETYDSPVLGWLRPYVWKGLTAPPATPPPPPLPPSPPQLPRRSNGGGIDPLEEDYANIHVYEGDDSLERAARDLLQSFDDVAPCHCGHHHPEEEY